MVRGSGRHFRTWRASSIVAASSDGRFHLHPVARPPGADRSVSAVRIVVMPASHECHAVDYSVRRIETSRRFADLFSDLLRLLKLASRRCTD